MQMMATVRVTLDETRILVSHEAGDRLLATPAELATAPAGFDHAQAFGHEAIRMNRTTPVREGTSSAALKFWTSFLDECSNVIVSQPAS